MFFERTVIVMFILSVTGYIFTVLKEKLYLKNNIIVIDNKFVTQEHLEETDIKEFVLNGVKVKSGDEIKVITHEKKRYNGIIIGAKRREQSILMVTNRNEIKQLKINKISKLKIISKYGKFLT